MKELLEARFPWPARGQVFVIPALPAFGCAPLKFGRWLQLGALSHSLYFGF